MVAPDPAVFAALGDATRLQLVQRLLVDAPLSTTALTEGTPMTRQAVRKHLQVLADVGLVHDRRQGRERLWVLDPAPLSDISDWVAAFQRHCEQRLDRLDRFLSAHPDPDCP